MSDTWTAPSPDAAPVSLRMRKTDPMDKYRLTPEMLRKIIEDSERPIRQFLDKNRAYARCHSLGALIVEVMKLVPGAADKGVHEVRYIIKDWARKAGVRIPTLSTPPHPGDPVPGKVDLPSAMDDLIKSVKDAVQTAKDGVNVRMGKLETKVSVTGATAKLGPFGAEVTPTGDYKGTMTGKGRAGEEAKLDVGKDGTSASVKDGKFKSKFEISWEGEMKLSTSYDTFKLSGAVSSKSWSVTLTFNTDKMPPYPGAIGRIFAEGEQGVRGILAETAKFRRIEDIPDLPGKIEPHLKPVKKAIGTAGALAGLKEHISFGIEVKGPGPAAGADDKGASVMAVVTVRF